MEEKIKKYLTDLEQEKGIEILLACETCSMAFPSLENDFNVWVMYKPRNKGNLSLFK